MSHALERRAWGMDLRIDNCPRQMYFKPAGHCVSMGMTRAAVVLAAWGRDSGPEED